MRARDVAVPGRARDERPSGDDDERGPRESGRPPERARVADAFGPTDPPTSLGSPRGCVPRTARRRGYISRRLVSGRGVGRVDASDVFPDDFRSTKKSPRRLAPRARARRASRVGLGLPLRRVGVESSSAPGWRGCMVRVVSRSRPDLAGALGFATGLASSEWRGGSRGSAPVRGPGVGVVDGAFFFFFRRDAAHRDRGRGAQAGGRPRRTRERRREAGRGRAGRTSRGGGVRSGRGGGGGGGRGGGGGER